MIDEKLYKNLEYNINNFEKTKRIKSVLRFGNETQIVEPLISFVIPAYSRIKELEIAIRSIIEQEELFSYEVVIVDDAPDSMLDNPRLDLVKAINDVHILYYANTENLGVEGNWNRCIQLARGKYVSMLHDDDILSPLYMKSIMACLETVEKKSNNFGLIQAKFKIFTNDADLPTLDIKNRGGIRKIYKINCLINGKGPVSPPSCGTIFDRCAIIEMGGFNEIFFPCADYLLGYFMVAKGYDCYVSEDDFGWYRFGINESVKPSVIQDTIRCNYFFLQWLYKVSLFNKLWSKLFGKAHISLLHDEYNNARRFYCNFVVPNEMSACITEYGKHNIGRFFVKIIKKGILLFTRRVYYVQ